MYFGIYQLTGNYDVDGGRSLYRESVAADERFAQAVLASTG
jgi:hypothetical protein